ncbi:MAG: aminodeoxychorismate synthase component I [Lysobacterales bacterium]
MTKTVRLKLAGSRDLLALAAAHPERYPCFLESSALAPRNGRFDFLFLHEGEVLEAASPADGARFLSDLALSIAHARTPSNPEESHDRVLAPSFGGGCVLFLGYEMAMACEPCLHLPPAPRGMPTALALRCPAAIAVDRVQDCTWLIVEPGREELLDVLRTDLAAAESFAPRALGSVEVAEPPAAAFLDAVSVARKLIAAGDVFQVNLSRRWDIGFTHSPRPADVHHALRRSNPSPFAALLQWRDYWIASSSPERLVAIDHGMVSTRPIAGTRPRHPGDDDDARREELIAHPKERAEHVMLVDLERNDLGRVCVAGSIVVDEMMTMESYAHVHHIVSNVCGRLRADVTPVDVIRAVFPGGTITGAPKVRCMQIIGELECEGRGAYTGSLGWLDRGGAMDLNILIRTFEGEGKQARFRAGAGIVAESNAETELMETRAKARGLLQALESSA